MEFRKLNIFVNDYNCLFWSEIDVEKIIWK